MRRERTSCRPMALFVVALAATALLAMPASASAAPTPFPGSNPWVAKRFLNIAHQGGEDEVPSATMYALRSAITEGGADMLEIDVQLTSDGQLVVLHDDVYHTKSCLPALCVDAATDPERPESQIRDMTLAEVQALDAAYWFRPNASPNTYARDYSLPASAFTLRGIRTGAKPPPAGYTANDFRIPTLREVLDAFPTTPINIEIKMPKSNPTPRPFRPSCVDGPPQTNFCDDLDLTIPTTEALIALFNTQPYAARRDVLVVSFAQEPMSMFGDPVTGAPQIFRAPSESDLVAYVLTGGSDPLDPDAAAFQVPPQTGILSPPEALLGSSLNAHANNRAVHVFTDGDDDETPAEYQRLYDLGVDGIMTSRPRALHAHLCAQEVPRPSGADRCPPPVKKKKCKKGKKLKKGKCVKKKKRKKKAKKRAKKKR